MDRVVDHSYKKQRPDWQDQLMIRAAWMSYKGGFTQGEIAKQLGLSNIKVHRLLARAQETGLVQVTIHGNPENCLEAEQDIQEHFGLNHCIVAPNWSADASEEQAIQAISEAGGQLFASLMQNKAINKVGVGMGRTLKAAVLSMPTIKRPDMNIMSVTGSLTRKLSANPYDLVQHFVERTGGDGYFLPVPYLAETFQEKEIFLNQKGIQELLSKAQDAELYLLGLGSLIKDGHLMQFGMMNDDERKHLEENNVVADLMGHFITQSGEIYREGFADHAVTFALEKIKNKHVVVIAAGKSKADALLACLKTGIIKDLLIDESLASELLKKLGTA